MDFKNKEIQQGYARICTDIDDFQKHGGIEAHTFTNQHGSLVRKLWDEWDLTIPSGPLPAGF